MLYLSSTTICAVVLLPAHSLFAILWASIKSHVPSLWMSFFGFATTPGITPAPAGVNIFVVSCDYYNILYTNTIILEVLK